MKQVTINNNCISLTVLDYGAIIQKIEVRNKKNELTNVAVGFEDPSDYLNDTIFLGACVGRYAGRISGGGFDLKGKRYSLYHQDGVHLHGGKEGLGKKFWSIDSVNKDEKPSVKLSYTSRAMEEGYPGEVKVAVVYQLIGNALHIRHKASTDETTVINLTNHSYFRLDDEARIDHYFLQLKSKNILETRENLVPSGRVLPVKNTPYDFRHRKRIAAISLDTPYILDGNTGVVARVHSPASGISMKVQTNQPAIVVYRPKDFPALCLETQNHPDAPNHSHFPSSVLQPGETYNNTSIFEFDLVI